MLAGDSLADLVTSNYGDAFKKSGKGNVSMNKAGGGGLKPVAARAPMAGAQRTTSQAQSYNSTSSASSDLMGGFGMSSGYVDLSMSCG